MEMIDKVLDA